MQVVVDTLLDSFHKAIRETIQQIFHLNLEILTLQKIFNQSINPYGDKIAFFNIFKRALLVNMPILDNK